MKKWTIPTTIWVDVDYYVPARSLSEAIKLVEDKTRETSANEHDGFIYLYADDDGKNPIDNHVVYLEHRLVEDGSESFIRSNYNDNESDEPTEDDVISNVSDKIRDAFFEYQKDMGIESGDISPEDAYRLDVIEKEIAEIIMRSGY